MSEWREFWSNNDLNETEKQLQNIVLSLKHQSVDSFQLWIARFNLLVSRAAKAMESNQLHRLKDVLRESIDLTKDIECECLFCVFIQRRFLNNQAAHYISNETTNWIHLQLQLLSFRLFTTFIAPFDDRTETLVDICALLARKLLLFSCALQTSNNKRKRTETNNEISANAKKNDFDALLVAVQQFDSLSSTRLSQTILQCVEMFLLVHLNLNLETVENCSVMLLIEQTMTFARRKQLSIDRLSWIGAGFAMKQSDFCLAAQQLEHCVSSSEALFLQGIALLLAENTSKAVASFEQCLQQSTQTYRFAGCVNGIALALLQTQTADWRAVVRRLRVAAQQIDRHNTSVALPVSALRERSDAQMALLNLAVLFRRHHCDDAVSTMLSILLRSINDNDATLLQTECVIRLETDKLLQIDAMSRDAVEYLYCKSLLLNGHYDEAKVIVDAHVDRWPTLRSPLLPDVVVMLRDAAFVCVFSNDALNALRMCDWIEQRVAADPLSLLLRADALTMTERIADAHRTLERLEALLCVAETTLSEKPNADIVVCDQRQFERTRRNSVLFDASQRLRLRTLTRVNRALLQWRQGNVADAVRLLRMVLLAAPRCVLAAYNYTLIAHTLGGAYAREGCVAWLEARQQPVVDAPHRFRALELQTRAQLDALSSSSTEIVMDPVIGGGVASSVHDNQHCVRGAVPLRHALALDAVVFARWSVHIADAAVRRQLQRR